MNTHTHTKYADEQLFYLDKWMADVLVRRTSIWKGLMSSPPYIAMSSGDTPVGSGPPYLVTKSSWSIRIYSVPPFFIPLHLCCEGTRYLLCSTV